MADYFVASGGSNTSPYDTWAKASTSLATALAAATASGDRVIIQYDGVPSTDSALSADVTYTAANNIAIISSTNSGTSTVTPTVMDGNTANQFIGHSSLSRAVTLSAGAYKMYVYGVALRSAASTSGSLSLLGPGGAIYAESCLFRCGTTNTAARIVLGGAISGNQESFFQAKDCTFRFGATAQAILLQGKGEIIGGSISSAGSAITTVFVHTGPHIGNPRNIYGFDLSAAASTANLTAGSTSDAFDMRLYGCKLPSSFTLFSRASGNTNKSSGEIFLFDCASGDTHYHFAHADMAGDTVIDTGIYSNDGATPDNGTTRTTWKVSGTANASYYAPYISPWIDRYHSGTSAITPYLECLRDNSSGAVYTDDQVWSEWSYQGTSGYTLSTIVSDRMALAGTPANQTASSKTASDWTGETGTPGLFKLQPTSAITPAEIGHLRARVCVGGAYTVYVDPQIRGT